MPIGDAPCISLARVLKKLLMVVCDESVLPPSAATRLLKLVCRLLNVGSDVAAVAAVELVDEDSLASDAASCSTRLCIWPPPP